MILEYLEEMRTRPVHERKRFAYLVSTVLTGIIAIIWLSVLTMEPSTNLAGDTERSTAQERTAPGLWERFKGALSLSGSDETPDTPDESQRDLTPPPTGAFTSVFDDTDTGTSTASSTVGTTTPQGPPAAAQDVETGLVDSVLEEVGR